MALWKSKAEQYKTFAAQLKQRLDCMTSSNGQLAGAAACCSESHETCAICLEACATVRIVCSRSESGCGGVKTCDRCARRCSKTTQTGAQHPACPVCRSKIVGTEQLHDEEMSTTSSWTVALAGEFLGKSVIVTGHKHAHKAGVVVGYDSRKQSLLVQLECHDQVVAFRSTKSVKLAPSQCSMCSKLAVRGKRMCEDNVDMLTEGFKRAKVS